MDFWRIDKPQHPEGDYGDTYVNGYLEHPYGLPGIKCGSCGATWAGSRVLPITTPAHLRTQKHLRDSWPIPSGQHAALRAEVREALAAEGCAVEELAPGDRFQPSRLRIPTVPEADFLWPSFGAPLVHERVRHLLVEAGVTGVEFCPVEFEAVGSRAASLPPPIPASGEPEDLLEEMETLPSVEGLPQYFEMVVLAESGLPRGSSIKSRCADCGREELTAGERSLSMRPELWTGTDVFFLRTTLLVVVTDRVKELLLDAGASNVVLSRATSL